MVDLLLGGSPCQGFSFAGKVLNFFDPRSRLFFEYVKALKLLKPKYFILENVKMKKEYQDIISNHLGVQPIEINSALLSGQNRVRLYWTNIPGVVLPEDKNISLQDILENTEYTNPGAIRGRNLKGDAGVKDGYTQCLEVKSENISKSNCLTTVGKDNVLTTLPAGKYPDALKTKLPFRYYTLKEYCRLQTLPDTYLDVLSDSAAKKCVGNGWTVDVVAHILRHIPESTMDTVVSLFDGISCGQLALERAGKVYNTYYASEIEKHAIQVTQHNYPNTIQLGDVTKVDWVSILDTDCYLEHID